MTDYGDLFRRCLASGMHPEQAREQCEDVAEREQLECEAELIYCRITAIAESLAWAN